MNKYFCRTSKLKLSSFMDTYMYNEQDKIKVTFTCTREVAAEIHSAITLYSGMTPDIEDDREDEDEIIAELVKVGEKIYRSSSNNKAI